VIARGRAQIEQQGELAAAMLGRLPLYRQGVALPPGEAANGSAAAGGVRAQAQKLPDLLQRKAERLCADDEAQSRQVEALNGAIQIEPLPAYAPDLNPTEYI